MTLNAFLVAEMVADALSEGRLLQLDIANNSQK